MAGPSERRRQFRQEVGHRESPALLMSVGGLILVITVVNFLVPPRGTTLEYAATIVIGGALVLVGGLMRRPTFPAPAIPWVVLGCSVVVFGLLLVSYRLDPSDANVAWVVVVLLVFGPATGDLRAFTIGAVAMGATFAVAGFLMQVPDLANWVLVAVACLAIGGLLLVRRIGSLDQLADATVLAEELATRDPLTGVLNRHGLTVQVPLLLATARRLEVPVFAAFVDVRGLKAANDRFGHRYGDHVLSTVAQALRHAMRESDLVARWGGDEFIALGLGQAPTEAEIEERVQQQTRSGAAHGPGWDGRVTAGCATGSPADGIDGLIASADDRMYARRRSDAGRTPATLAEEGGHA